MTRRSRIGEEKSKARGRSQTKSHGGWLQPDPIGELWNINDTSEFVLTCYKDPGFHTPARILQAICGYDPPTLQWVGRHKFPGSSDSVPVDTVAPEAPEQAFEESPQCGCLEAKGTKAGGHGGSKSRS